MILSGKLDATASSIVCLSIGSPEYVRVFILVALARAIGIMTLY